MYFLKIILIIIPYIDLCVNNLPRNRVWTNQNILLLQTKPMMKKDNKSDQ